MDPITHTLAGAALARGGRMRAAPLALATAIIAANAPDVDIASYAAGEYAGLAFRRGWSHGPLAWLVLPFVVVGCILAYDRYVRRRRRPTAAPTEAAPLLALAVLAVLSHPALDWLNTYGIRLLAPFSGRWFYGDAVFIIDPWIWLGLGGVLFLGGARTGPGKAVWLGAGLLGTVIMLGVDVVPWPAKLVWTATVVALASWRVRRGPLAEYAAVRLVRWGGLAVVVYAAVMAFGSRLAERHIRAELEALGTGPIRTVMVGPTPANPFHGAYIAATAGAYYRGDYAWLRTPRVRPAPDSLPRVTPDRDLATAARPVAAATDIAAAARADPRASDYLVWARFPYVRIVVLSRGYDVRIGDARFEGQPGAGSLSGIIVRLDDDLRLVPR